MLENSLILDLLSTTICFRFKIKLFTDPSFTKEITTTTTTLFIGQPVYTTVEWNVKTLTNHAKYYVDGCSIQLPKDSASGAERAMQLIKSNCYSSTLQVQQLQASKLVKEKLIFITFFKLIFIIFI